jgi:hypothetical protein
MKRYYLCPIVGDGSEFNTYRAKVADYNVNHLAVIPVDMTTGKPLFTWCLVLVDTINHTPILNDLAINAMPDFNLDGKVADIPSVTANALKTTLQTKYAVNITGINIYRMVIRKVGQTLDHNYNENNFDVSG